MSGVGAALATCPAPHRDFIGRAIDRLADDPRLVGVAAAGSFADDTMDEFSDVDLVIAVEPGSHVAVMEDRERIAEGLGPLLAAFTGEHVGDPRLLICLYGPPPLHVDLKFVVLPEAGRRGDEPVVLWERDGRLTAVLRTTSSVPPQPDPQWIEDRFWVWVHYIATKIGRGEIFEALDALSFLRARVLGPLGLQRAGHRPTGVRRVEVLAPALADLLRSTVPPCEPGGCLLALRASVDVYRGLRGPGGAGGLRHRAAAEAAALDYLADLERRR